MTTERVIEILKDYIEHGDNGVEIIPTDEDIEALHFAIKALVNMDCCPVFSDDEVKQPCYESLCSIRRNMKKATITFTNGKTASFTYDENAGEDLDLHKLDGKRLAFNDLWINLDLVYMIRLEDLNDEKL